ncbi:MAG: YhdH/YhfP family quinone oxidoreductase [Tissierella sp.]|uniref:YhdH/YhfP family quinone oxidoreductase n=1 Tax=Tissierella sp. TaxID=41274 RepID=UPI003F9DC39A
MNNKFKAMLITETAEKKYERNIVDKEIKDLPEGDILINVKYSSLNYKDALSSIGNKGVTRNYPHTPGIDAAGLVVESSSDKFQAGDKVIVTGYDLGMNTWGGYGEYIRVPKGWVVKLPEGLTLKESMIYGTAGFTAALSVYRLINAGVKPEDGEILVTGATGGVGSTAISILNKLNYDVIAASGKASKKDMLVKIGAKDVIGRSELENSSNRALLKGSWAGVIDTVGGDILSNAIKSTKYGGSVTCCGNVSSGDLDTSIYPFILRGVSLLGVDSVQTDMETRIQIWNHLASDWKIDNLDENVEEVSLEEVSEKIDQMLEGKHSGRTIINIEK